jgi:hypothetical protein
MKDGHLNICKTCTRTRVRKHRAENDHVREYDRMRNKRDAYRQEHLRKLGSSAPPERKKANMAVSNAIRDGRLHRPSICIDCNKNCKPEGHHEDYSKPLDVIWLCQSCHAKRHTFCFPF